MAEELLPDEPTHRGFNWGSPTAIASFILTLLAILSFVFAFGGQAAKIEQNGKDIEQLKQQSIPKERFDELYNRVDYLYKCQIEGCGGKK